MNFDDTAKFGNGTPTVGEHLCPQCELNGRSTWTQNKIFCDRCIVVRESYGFWSEQAAEQRARRKCTTIACHRLVEGRVRYCSRCIAARRREQYRKSKQASRCPIARNLADWD